MKNFQCCCEKEHDTKEEMARCHRRHHGDAPECLYDKIGTTCDKATDALCRRFFSVRRELHEAQARIGKLETAYKLTDEERARYSIALESMRLTLMQFDNTRKLH